MKVSEIKNSISTLSGIGPKNAALFAKLNVFTTGDLIQFYPRDYEDRTQRIPLCRALDHQKVHTVAKVLNHEWFGFGRMKTLKLIVSDSTQTAQLIAFNRPFLEKTFPVGSIISLTAHFEFKYQTLQSTSFEAEKLAEEGELKDWANTPLPDSKIFALYHLTEGLNQKNVRKAVDEALKRYANGIDDELPENLISEHKLLPKKDALKIIHQPADFESFKRAQKTLAYEELFKFQLSIADQAWAHRGKLPLITPVEQNTPDVSEEDFNSSLSPRQKQYLARLPFNLTQDQKNVIYGMNQDIDKSYGQKEGSNFNMRSLLQGDVGSGKTLVSFFAVLRTSDYGSQSALMAPTEILARQHAENAARELEPLGIHAAFLTGNINAKGRKLLLDALKDGSIDLVIGTHALFSKNVIYRDLSLAIIDEQHRFGVMQRSAIVDKAQNSLDKKINGANLLMMSATPIPQTLAQTVFSDLDVFTIKTMPSGRKPVQTYLTKEGNERNAYEAVRQELRQGRQAYFVYPAIGEDADSRDLSEGAGEMSLKAAEDMFKFLSTKVYPEYKCALIHGKIDDEEQSRILREFKEGTIQILVATTVVEVGVDNPNATCMVIEQADRFGLAALHQLRGRVGRGSAQSYCFLIYSKNISQSGIERMKAIRQTTDGFKIAEEDLKLRGPGQITGTLQSGQLTFAIADLARDSELMAQARLDAFNYYAMLHTTQAGGRV